MWSRNPRKLSADRHRRSCGALSMSSGISGHPCGVSSRARAGGMPSILLTAIKHLLTTVAVIALSWLAVCVIAMSTGHTTPMSCPLSVRCCSA